MADKARSSDPRVQAQLDRLSRLSPGRDVLGLDRIAHLLDRLGNPQLAMPPVFHVAGTNGKGSTCAFLRAALEAAGYLVHVYSSPHLVRFNERIRLAGRLIEDDILADFLAMVLDVADGIEPSFFEVTTAVAFLAFARFPADACVIEVGLGGRLDATNIIADPLVAGIAQLGIDHQAFLGDSLAAIASEKAGIAKAGRPLVTQDYPYPLPAIIAERALVAGAIWLARGRDWDAAIRGEALCYRDRHGTLVVPLPQLAGRHQADNAALAIAMLRHQYRLDIPDSALIAAMHQASWPARLQRLKAGPLRDLLPPSIDLWLDGGHNPDAARVVADHLRARLRAGQSLALVLGLLANKDPEGILACFDGLADTIHAVPVPDHEHHAPESLAGMAAARGMAGHATASVAAALRDIAAASDPANPPLVAIIGSLYLAGTVLEANAEWPD